MAEFILRSEDVSAMIGGGYSVEQIGIWTMLLQMATDNPKPGRIEIRPGVGYSDKQLSRTLKCAEKSVAGTIKKLQADGKIVIVLGDVIEISLWSKFEGRAARLRQWRYQNKQTPSKPKTPVKLMNLTNTKKPKTPFKKVESSDGVILQNQELSILMCSIDNSPVEEKKIYEYGEGQEKDISASKEELEKRIYDLTKYYEKCYIMWQEKFKGRRNHPGFFGFKDARDSKWWIQFERLIPFCDKYEIDPRVWINAQMWAYGKFAAVPPPPNHLRSDSSQENYDRYIAEREKRPITRTDAPGVSEIDAKRMLAKVKDVVTRQYPVEMTDRQIVAFFHFEIEPLADDMLAALGLTPDEAEAVYSKL